MHRSKREVRNHENCSRAGQLRHRGGAGRVYDALAQALSGTAHELTIAGCIGMCYLEPIVDIYEESGALTRLVRVQQKDVPTIAKAVETGDQSALAALMITDDDKAFLDQQTRIALRHCGVINPEKIEDYLADGGYSSIRKALASMAPEDVIETIKVSGLKGRGGAAFPPGLNGMRRAKSRPSRNTSFAMRMRRPRCVYGSRGDRRRPAQPD